MVVGKICDAVLESEIRSGPVGSNCICQCLS